MFQVVALCLSAIQQLRSSNGASQECGAETYDNCEQTIEERNQVLANLRNAHAGNRLAAKLSSNRQRQQTGDHWSKRGQELFLDWKRDSKSEHVTFLQDRSTQLGESLMELEVSRAQLSELGAHGNEVLVKNSIVVECTMAANSGAADQSEADWSTFSYVEAREAAIVH